MGGSKTLHRNCVGSFRHFLPALRPQRSHLRPPDAEAVSFREARGPMTKFVAYAVDLSGTALARYDLAAADAEAAERETRQYLEEHPLIEVWGSDHRVVSQFE